MVTDWMRYTGNSNHPTKIFSLYVTQQNWDFGADTDWQFCFRGHPKNPMMRVCFRKKKHLLRMCSDTLAIIRYNNALNDSGTFGEDIGEDYFGFKELGLDREYNIDAFSVCNHRKKFEKAFG